MLSLIVITTKDVGKSLFFYESFGLYFKNEQHGNGPVHYSSEHNGIVIEIYPETNTNKSENSLKLGFKVDDLQTFKLTLTNRNIPFKDGVDLLILQDVDGRKIFVSKW